MDYTPTVMFTEEGLFGSDYPYPTTPNGEAVTLMTKDRVMTGYVNRWTIIFPDEQLGYSAGNRSFYPLPDAERMTKVSGWNPLVIRTSWGEVLAKRIAHAPGWDMSMRENRRDLRRLRVRLWFADRSRAFSAAVGVVTGIGIVFLLQWLF